MFNKFEFHIIKCSVKLESSLVHCYLKYCIVSWGTASNTVLQ